MANSNAAARQELFYQWVAYLHASRTNTIYSVPTNPGATVVEPDQTSVSFEEIASIFGSTLGRFLGGSNLVIGTAAGSVLSAAALSIGQIFFKVNYFPNPNAAKGVLGTGTGSVLHDIGNNLEALSASAAVGAVSSYLASEFTQAIGIKGIAGDVVTNITGDVLQYEITKLANSSGVFGNLFQQAASQTVGDLLKSGFADFVGTELASLIVQPHTVAESTLASLGSAVGAAYGTLLGGPPGAVIGAFIGFIVGDLIGSLFGHHKPRLPSANVEVTLQIPFAQYGLGMETEKHHGNLAYAEQMAGTARDTLNGIIQQITGSPVPSYVTNLTPVTEIYGYKALSSGDTQTYLKINGGAEIDVASADQAVDKGVLAALPLTKIVGGDLFLKRAIQNGQWGTVTALLGDLQIATDYETYLRDEPVIDAAIGSSFNSLSAADQAFYTANQAFVTRAISGVAIGGVAPELPLTGNDVSFYNANKTQVDRILGSISVSTFAAGWITTLARAAELGLDRFGASDFFGGMAGFLQSLGVNATGTTEHYEDFTPALHPDGSLYLTAAGAAPAGAFALLPQALEGPAGDDVTNPHFQQGMAGWTPYSSTGQYDGGVDLTTGSAATGDLAHWFGDGNDVVWDHLAGTPAAGATYDVHSDYIASTAGTTYEASVSAAQHRGTAQLLMTFFDANKTQLGQVQLASGGYDIGAYGGDPTTFDNLIGYAKAPAGTAYRRVVLRDLATGTGSDPYAFFTRPESHAIGGGTANYPLAIVNPSFETVAVAPGTNTSSVVGWGASSGVGTWNPNGAISGVSGSNAVIMNDGNTPQLLQQDVGKMVAGTTYIFSADTGIRSDVGGNNTSGIVSLSIQKVDAHGNVTNAATNSFTPTVGSLVTHSAFYTATIADDGQTLRVVVQDVTNNTYVAVDNTILTASTGLSQDLPNPRFLQGEEDWQFSFANAPAADTGIDRAGYFGRGNDVLYEHISGTSNGFAETKSVRVTALPGQLYQYSFQAAASQGGAAIAYIDWYDASGTLLSKTGLTGRGKANGGQNGDPTNFTLISGTVTAPTNAVYRDIDFRIEAQGTTDAYGYFMQPIFRLANINSAVANWNSEPASYTAGTLPDWDAAGTSARIANFGASTGYNTNGSFSNGNDLVDQHAALTAVNLGDASSSNGEGGDDIILGGSAGDTLNGYSGADWLDGGTGNDSLIGGTGNDVLLGQGGADTLEGDDGDDYLSGGDGNDTLNGNNGNDVLVGGAGSDTVNGGAGDDTLIVDQDGGALTDTLDGGNGMDAASFERFTSGVTASLLSQASGDALALLVAGAVLLPGQSLAAPNGTYHLDYQTDGNLVLYGPGQSSSNYKAIWASWTNGKSTGRVFLDGGGNLVILDQSGATIWSSNTAGLGGSVLALDNAGLLTIERDDGVTTWTASGSGPGSIAASSSTIYGDSLKNIEDLIGSNFNDVLGVSNTGGQLKGLAGDDVLNGGAGNDLLEGGAGADQLNGGGGVNTASYEASSAGVYVSLATVTAIGGDATGDTFSSIQNLTGSAFGDELAGDGGANVISTGAGDDWIDATLGADVYNGGAGSDTLDYSAIGSQASSGYTVSLNVSSGQAVLTTGSTSTTQRIAGVEQFLGTPFRDYLTSDGGTVGVTLDGDGGGDALLGGTGSDTYVFDKGYGTTTVSDTNAGSNVVSFKQGITFDDLYASNQNGTFEIGLRGDTTKIEVGSNFQSGNNVIKTIDLAGAAHVDVTDLDGGNILTDNGDAFVGNPNLRSAIFGYAGNDNINSNNNQVTSLGNIIAGGLGDDYLYSSTGDDQYLYERGDGFDTIHDAGGRNTIVFGPTVAADDVIYQVVGNDLWVGLKDPNNPSTTANQVASRLEIINGGEILSDLDGVKQDRYATAFSVEAGGATTDLTKADIAYTTVYYHSQPTNGGGGGGGGRGNIPPIVFDLTGDGLELSQVGSSNIASQDAAGNIFRTAWIGPTNGILAYDRTGDGALNQSSDISFIGDKAGASSDLEGLSGWDTNSDGILDAQDTNFSKLLIWVDSNVDGRAETGEALSLAARGITSVNLTESPTGYDDSDTFESVVSNTTSFTRIDGSTGTAYDVSLARQLLNGQTAAVAGPDIDLSAPVVIGEFTGSSTVDASAMAKSVYGKQSALDATAQTDFLAAGDATISQDQASFWSVYLDPTKIAERKAEIARGYITVAALPTIENTTDLPADAATLDGRGLTAKPDQLQAVVVDLGHNGPSLIDPTSSTSAVDVGHTGVPVPIGWVAPSDAILAYDANGDGQVSASSEVSFVGDVPNARTGFQGLEAFDTNRDGQLTADDVPFARFLLWRDANGNGISDAGETQTLKDAGITGVDLAGSVVRPSLAGDTGNTVLGATSISFADGSTKAAYDVALGFADATDDTAPTGTTTIPVAQPAPVAIPDASTTVGPTATQPINLVQAPSTDVANGAAGSVAGSRGSLDGPDGEIVASTSGSGADLPWWRDAAVVGATLAGLATPLSAATGTTPFGLAAAAAASPDAAELQRQQLLRQSIAALQSPAGGSAAIWGHSAANDDGMTVASANDQHMMRAVLPVAVGG